MPPHSRAVPRPAPPIPDPRAWQRAFFAQIGGVEQLLALLEHVPNGFFFLKDRDSRIVWVTQSILARFGVRHLDELIGKSDYDSFAKPIADDFVRDDQTVLRTGRPIIRRVEMWYSERHVLDWAVTTKLPVFDHEGRTIGIIGVVENSPKASRALLSDPRLAQAIDYIQQHHRGVIEIADLAAASGLSARQLLRKFREEFGVTPQQFMLKARIQAASDALLRENATISEVAIAFRFCDQSAFTRQFRRFTGLTPMAYQRNYGRRRESHAS